VSQNGGWDKPWSSSSGLNWKSWTLFSVWKSAVLKQQSVEYHIHQCKNWLSRFGGFWCGFYFPDSGNSRNSWPRPLTYHSLHSAICRDVAWYATAGRFLYDPSRPSQRDMPTVAQTGPNIARIANTRQWIRGWVVAKSAGSGEPDFTSMDALIYGP
jgi:hypothetical protein